MAYPEPHTDLSSALATGKVVSRDYHQQAVAVAVERAERKANAVIYHLQSLVEIADAGRVARVCAALDQVTHARNLKHSPDCWQRHAGCLANRIRDLLDGRRPDLGADTEGGRPVETITPVGGVL